MSNKSTDGAAAGLSLGLHSVIRRGEAEQLHLLLLSAFHQQYGTSEGLRADLKSTGAFFNPISQGHRLRSALALLSPVTVPASIADDWFLAVDSETSLLTPEGVAAMHALGAALDDPRNDFDVLTTAHALNAASCLYDLYREWSRHRIVGVVSLLNGEDKPLQVRAAGVLLAMLVNNNTSPENAVQRYGASHQKLRNLIDLTFFAPVERFAAALVPTSSPKTGGARLISGWSIGEVSRRLGDSFVTTKASRDSPSSIYVHPEGTTAAIELIARDLARGHRKRPTVEELAVAFDGLVEQFRRQEGDMARYGLLHENPSTTAAIRNRLVRAYSSALANREDRE
ncbi:hypothetical protein [Salinibacterium sp. ZJ450]|uniref:hypothetical protein n=1 Tax=Salinibacterium sp. ZJ450 TaxID=2708338 RepID=UPI00141FA476|nr:hypothetical protein [Salinibacterium sp. ZJ450]